MSGLTRSALAPAAVLAAWAALSALRSTADRRWAEVEAAVAAHAEAERAGGAAGPPTWTWDVGRNRPVPLPSEAPVLREGELATEVVVVPEDAGPRTSVPLWVWASAPPTRLFHGEFALASVALGALALGLRVRRPRAGR